VLGVLGCAEKGTGAGAGLEEGVEWPKCNDKYPVKRKSSTPSSVYEKPAEVQGEGLRSWRGTGQAGKLVLAGGTVTGIRKADLTASRRMRWMPT